MDVLVSSLGILTVFQGLSIDLTDLDLQNRPLLCQLHKTVVSSSMLKGKEVR